MKRNAIVPGYLDMPMNAVRAAVPAFSPLPEGCTPWGRRGRVEDPEGARTLPSSDTASFVNGHVLFVDGESMTSP
ncbi:MAG: hypothetical protein ACK4RZ_10585 [Paracoccaceae bacterium]